MQDLWPTAFVHDLNPFLIRFSESFGIRWYGLSYLLGFYLGYRFILWLANRRLTALAPEQVSDFVFTVALGTILGGRLGYCLFYSPSMFTSFSSTPPFWGVLAINQGGMASHGGIVGIILACIWFARSRGLPILQLLDLNTIGGTLGIFFGRIANFVNSELVGREAPPALPWAVKFPKDILLWPTEEPARLTSLAPAVEHVGVPAARWSELVSAPFLHREEVHSVLLRIVDHTESGDKFLTRLIAPALTGRHPSQLYAALLEGALLFVVLFLVWAKPQKPGIIAALFLTLYPMVRILGERFRMPDPGIGFQLWGLTRGQWLSVVMVLVATAFLAWVVRRPGDKIGGWRSDENCG